MIMTLCWLKITKTIQQRFRGPRARALFLTSVFIFCVCVFEIQDTVFYFSSPLLCVDLFLIFFFDMAWCGLTKTIHHAPLTEFCRCLLDEIAVR